MDRAETSRRGKSDMISSLPDCLIHLIMSFLTAQEAVRTCVLSNRWKNLWTTLPFLDFDLSKFDYERSKFGKFRDFVTMTLLLREASDLHKFRLSCQEMSYWSEYHMFYRAWILYALKHNLRALNITSIEAGVLPVGVFTCASLVDASLSSFYSSMQVIKVVNLPCLRRLHLNGINLNQGFIEKLLHGCPVLEFLHLGRCCRELFNINSQSLKYLIVEDCDLDEETKEEIDLINTPNLLSLCYSIRPLVIGHKVLFKMPFLTGACINLEYSQNWSYMSKSVILVGLSTVENLTLYGFGIKYFLRNELPNCPEFSDLKDLYVCLSCDFNLLSSFLNHCPNLEKLSVFHFGCFCEVKGHVIQESLKIAPFKGKRLQTVEVHLERDKDFPRVVKYIQDIFENSKPWINVVGL
ncbi:FBD-associated F-box protein [Rhynchospora pubera]|uniref:FBD-associated F-box protein n=1 Tax=Rhynchospora pubera TaxID=906938 RepID=A0AAV8GXK9_9POAL|nr:FBD-associated F-box protein [Rhynchospora pubera]